MVSKMTKNVRFYYIILNINSIKKIDNLLEPRTILGPSHKTVLLWYVSFVDLLKSEIIYLLFYFLPPPLDPSSVLGAETWKKWESVLQII